MSPLLRSSVRNVLFASLVAGGAITGVQAAQQSASEVTEVVIVTGSFIRGTAEDAALPVEVIGSEELEKQGSPSALEMIKSISAMAGIVGESNQFTSGRGQAAEGTASINLRGFGAARTLVLLNGKRLASDDANTLPSSAIARVEVLKDGAAATYGSDAIGGVVNFITKSKFDGLELNGDYRYIEDSDGDYNAGLNWGHVGERFDAMVSANYFHRSQLLVRDRDWAITDYLRNPEGGWSGASNPTEFRPLSATFTPLPGTGLTVDPGCGFFGGVVTNAGTQCRTQYTLWDNLVEEQNSYQVFGQLNFDVTESTTLHMEALYASTEVPHASTTPSYATSRTITRTVSPPGIATGNQLAAINPALRPFGYDTVPDPDARSFFYVPRTNPGFQALLASGGMPRGSAGRVHPDRAVPSVSGGWQPPFRLRRVVQHA
jgi:iron complex outermembrane receptor protein